MKKLLLILLCLPLIFSCGKEIENSLSQTNIKGKVKAIKQTYFDSKLELIREDNFSYLTSNKSIIFSDQFEVQFNKDGNMTEYSRYNEDGELTYKKKYKYDEDWNSYFNMGCRRSFKHGT